jgi:hypothetical protein
MESYAGSMDDGTLRYKLTIPLIEKDYGDTAAEVLKTCALVAEYAQEHTPDQVKVFQENVEINPQVWLRLIALHKDERLKQHLKHLPASYTALYAVSRMKDEQIEAAIKQGIIHPSASSHAILAWSKQNRLTNGEAVPPWRCLVVFDQDLEEEELMDMRSRMNQIAQEYGARLIGESNYIPPESESNQVRKDLMYQLERQIVEMATPMLVRMTERDRARAGVDQPEDFLTIDMMTFGSVMRRDAKFHESGRNSYTPVYVYRLVLEYLRTDSRSQRFNYKRRLKQLAEVQSDLRECIHAVMTTYILGS